MTATAIESRQRAWALGLLLVIYVFNFIDRSILSILLQPIKAEFHPSDTALGLLSGIAFAVIYSLGIPIGAAFGVFAGGWTNEWFGWRTAFLVVGLPGVALAIVAQVTLREPPRVAHATDPPSAAMVARHLWALRSFRHLSLAGSLHALVGYGVATWNAAFLMRMHGMATGEAGSWLAGIALVAGGLGTYFGGVLADQLGRRDARWNLWLPGLRCWWPRHSAPASTCCPIRSRHRACAPPHPPCCSSC